MENEIIHPELNDFTWIDYIVLGILLCISAGIGIFYGCFGSRQNTNEEYLMGNRKMGAWPVAASLLCSFISAITVLGGPSEIYMYSTQLAVELFSLPLFTLTLVYIYVPVFFTLQLTSAYEFFELRYNRSVRLIISIVSVIYLLIYMSIVVLGPSIAMDQMTGVNYRIFSVAIFVVCIFYSTLGGFKAVIWTDALQTIVMLGSLLVIIIIGTNQVGGISIVWKRAWAGDRIEFLNFDVDPRTRYTVWSSMIGEYFVWLPLYAATQANIQRFVSMPDISTVRRCLLINLVGFAFLLAILYYTGLVIFAAYHDCDPVTAETITSSDKLLPYFANQFLGEYSGLQGFFVAGITCASLSSVSSGLNALAAIITEDYIKGWKPNLSDTQLARISKIVTVTTGLISFGFLFIAEMMGNIFPAVTIIQGMTLAPTFGMYSLGMFFPWANTMGSLIGLFTSFCLMLFLNVGSEIASSEGLLPYQKLSLDLDGCEYIINVNNTIIIDSSIYFNSSRDLKLRGGGGGLLEYDWKNESHDDGFLIQILSISYLWVPMLGCIVTIIIGLIASLIVDKFNKNSSSQRKKVNEKLLSPPFLKLWKLCFPNEMNELLLTTK